MKQVNNAQKAAKAIAAALLNYVYPVGSLYMSAEATSPASLFGGTWEQIKDRFILAAGDTYAAGSMGGEATHALTEAEGPSHSHKQINYFAYDKGNHVNWSFDEYGYILSNKQAVNPTSASYSGGSAIAYAGLTELSGNSKPHNNMPPYVALYVWKRIA